MEERKWWPFFFFDPSSILKNNQQKTEPPYNEVKGEGLISCDTITNIIEDEVARNS